MKKTWQNELVEGNWSLKMSLIKHKEEEEEEEWGEEEGEEFQINSGSNNEINCEDLGLQFHPPS